MNARPDINESMAREIEKAVGREADLILLARPGLAERVEGMDDIHRRHLAAAEARIAETKRALARAEIAFERDIAELYRAAAEAKRQAEASIETDRRLVAKCRAFLEPSA